MPRIALAAAKFARPLSFFTHHYIASAPSHRAQAAAALVYRLGAEFSIVQPYTFEREAWAPSIVADIVAAAGLDEACRMTDRIFSAVGEAQPTRRGTTERRRPAAVTPRARFFHADYQYVLHAPWTARDKAKAAAKYQYTRSPGLTADQWLSREKERVNERHQLSTKRFLAHLVLHIGAEFNPLRPISSYLVAKTGEPRFTPHRAELLEEYLQAAIAYADLRLAQEEPTTSGISRIQETSVEILIATGELPEPPQASGPASRFWPEV